MKTYLIPWESTVVFQYRSPSTLYIPFFRHACRSDPMNRIRELLIMIDGDHNYYTPCRDSVWQWNTMTDAIQDANNDSISHAGVEKKPPCCVAWVSCVNMAELASEVMYHSCPGKLTARWLQSRKFYTDRQELMLFKKVPKLISRGKTYREIGNKSNRKA